MAEYTIDKFTYGGNTYKLQDNESGYLTAADVPEGSSASTATPSYIAATPSKGTDNGFARGDHVHGISVTVGDNNGQVKVAGINASVKGLGSAAYTASTAYLPSSTVIPTQTSQLQNNSGFLTSAVTSLNSKTGAVTITAGNNVTVSATTNTITISATDTTYSDFVGTDSDEWGVGEDGVAGLVPAPPAGAKKAFLYGDGQWHGTWLAWDNNNHSISGMYNDGTQNTGWGSAVIPLASTATPGLIDPNDQAKLNYLSTASLWYGTCNTVTATANKEITLSSSYWPLTTYTLKTGNIINVYFNYPNTTTTPTINVNSTGAKPIRIGSAAPNGTDNQLMWDAGTLMSFIYDEAGDSGRGAYRYLTSVTYGTPYTQEISLVPIGTILDFAGSTAPTGYLICDGSAVSRTTYSDLFATIGTTWGNGDGSTTFNLPNLCGRATIGVGTGTATDATAHTLGDTNGTETHLLTANESGIHEHNHADTLTFKLPNHAHGLANSMIVYNNASSNTSRMATSGSGTKISVNTNVGLNTENPTSLSNCTKSGSVTKHNGADATTSHNNMQPYATVNKIIKAL